MGIYICIHIFAPTVLVKKKGAETPLRMNLTACYHAPKCSNQREVRDFAMAAVPDVTASVFAATDDGRARLFIL